MLGIMWYFSRRASNGRVSTESGWMRFSAKKVCNQIVLFNITQKWEAT